MFRNLDRPLLASVGICTTPLCRAGAVAHGSFTDSRHTRSGFGVLHVHTSAAFSDTEQMFAAGYLEGWLTAGTALQL